MGKKSKIGKQRKDKFYHLAKETGYRSRAAFKLIQLNRKFEFLQKSRVCIDLCAAPGGWMQVAKQNMPVSSIVIGVDMYSIKSLPGCITLMEDITTDKCRLSIKKELKTWKADVVLHDGAPNVGKNWLHDAYTQSCLTLSALKLATTFLREGGWFITKVFRSKDYNNLLYALKNLFKKVHATKPQASRNESAEIFVVCKHFLAGSIDEKLMNPNYVFKDVEAAPTVALHLGKKKKEKAEGYPDDTTILHTKLMASVFMQTDNPVIALQNAYEIVIDTDEILNHHSTTVEIKKCCEDIKVLGKKEIRDLIAWWKVFQDEKKQEAEKKAAVEEAKLIAEKSESNVIVDELDEEEKELDNIGSQIKELEDVERREKKRKRKKENKERSKQTTRLNLKMVHKNDEGPTEEMEMELFRVAQISSKKILDTVSDQIPEITADSDDEKETTVIKRTVKYNADSSYLDSSGMYYKTGESDGEEDQSDADSDINSEKDSLGFSDNEVDDQSKKNVVKKVRFADDVLDSEKEDDDPYHSHPLLTDLDFRTPKDKRLSKAQLWFDKEIFNEVENEQDEDYELDKMTSVIKNMGGRIIGQENQNVVAGSIASNTNCDVDDENDNEESSTDDDDDEEANKVPVSIQTEQKKPYSTPKDKASIEDPINEWDDVDASNLQSGKRKKKKERRTLDDEGLALGSMMIESQKTKRDLIDAGWNRYAFNDENLPDWFVEDELKHMRKEAPVPKELVDEYTKRREEINVRPIKKVAEAKARKKKRAIRRLEKAKKKLESAMENPDETDAEKVRRVKQIYKKLNQPKPNVKYVVAKKHTTSKRARRPRNLKGPYKVVDPRMKKDLRGKVSSLTKNKSKSSAKKIKKSFKPNRRKK